MGLWNYLMGRGVLVDKGELRELKESSNRVPSLEATVKDLTPRLSGAEKNLSEEKQTREATQSENSQLKKWRDDMSYPLNILLGAFNLPHLNLNQEPRHSSLQDLGRQIQDAAPYIPLLREHGDAIRAVVSTEEQKRNHRPYSGNPVDYVNRLRENTNFESEQSILTSATFMMQDLQRLFSSPYEDGTAWSLLEQLTSNKATAKILEAAGSGALDTLFQKKIAAAKGSVPKDLYDAVFDERIVPYLSNELKANITKLMMSSLQDSEYDQFPYIVMRARGVMNLDELKEKVKDTLMQKLYAGNSALFSAVSNHTAVKDVLGDNYNVANFLSDAVNRLQLHAKDPKSRIKAYEGLRSISQRLKVELREQDKQVMASGYISDVLTVNDKGRFEDTVKDPFIKESIGEEGIVEAVKQYLFNQKVPASKNEADFSAPLLAEYRERLGL